MFKLNKVCLINDKFMRDKIMLVEIDKRNYSNLRINTHTSLQYISNVCFTSCLIKNLSTKPHCLYLYSNVVDLLLEHL